MPKPLINNDIDDINDLNLGLVAPPVKDESHYVPTKKTVLIFVICVVAITTTIFILKAVVSKPQKGKKSEYAPSVSTTKTPEQKYDAKEPAAVPANSENDIHASTNGFNIAVSNCFIENPSIYVNGQQVFAVPVDGVILLENIPLNSEILAISVVDDIEYVASASFSNDKITTISFGNTYSQVRLDAEYRGDPLGFAYQEQEAEPFSNIYLPEYYSTVLDYITTGDTSDILRATSRQIKELEKWRNSSDITKYEYVYQGTGFNPEPESLEYTTDNGRPALEFMAFFQHQYAPAGSSSMQYSEVYYTVQMVYVDGEWKVNRWAKVSQDDYIHVRKVKFNKTL